ncbi:MAG: winged helix-turn-helix transcriptional regulator [Spirochaetes bacterium]|nr:winged helix-turn-helix transcriptional regulator [Spirochaetota bacterium]
MIELKTKIPENDISRKSKIIKTIAHPVRLKIFYGVAKKECNVKAMWQCLNLPQDVVSQHLAVMRKANILKTEKKGNTVIYSIVDDIDFKSILDFLESK